MEFKSEIKTIAQDLNRNFLLIVTIPANNVEKIQEFLDKEIIVNVSRKRKSRSLNANAYAWVLIQAMAEKLRVPKENLYIHELKKWSRSFEYMIIKKKAIEKLYKSNTFRYIEIINEGQSNGEETCQIIGYWGSSTFDTKEMSVFIDGLVEDAKELGIETASPEELNRLKTLWKG